MAVRGLLGVLNAGLLVAVLAGCGSPSGEDGNEPTAALPPKPSDSPDGAGGTDVDAAPPRPPRFAEDSKVQRLERAEQTLGGKEPAENDTLITSYHQDPDTINAIIATDNVSDAFLRNVYESLGQADFEDPDNILPCLATHWDFDEENLEFTIYLRRGVKWHPMKLPNGKELPPREFTARDVKFSFDCLLNPNVEAASLRSYFEDPEATDPARRSKIKVTVVDDYTVKIRWTQPYFLAKLFTLGAVPMIPRHVYSVNEEGEPISFDFGSKEFADGFNKHWANRQMCGTGPMRFNEWVRDERLVLVRNPDYWGAPYYFSQRIFRCIPNSNTAVQQGLKNDLDFVAVPEKDRFIQCKEHEAVTSGNVKPIDYEYPGYRYIGYNLRRDLLKDKQLRLALAHATPVQRMIDQVFEGLAVRVNGPFLPGSSQADPSVEPIPYDLEKAKEILEQAGWTDTDGNGIRDKQLKGVKVQASFDLMIFSDSPSFRAIAEMYQESCRKIGVEVQISPAKWALMLQKLRQFDFDAAMLGWGTSWSKGDPFQLWHGSQADVPDSSNHVGYRNDRVDELIEELRVTFDEKRQLELYHEIFRRIHADQPYTFLFSEKATALQDARIENVRFYRLRPCHDSREWFSTEPRELGP